MLELKASPPQSTIIKDSYERARTKTYLSEKKYFGETQMSHLLRHLRKTKKTLLWVNLCLFSHTFCKKCIKQYLKPHKNP